MKPNGDLMVRCNFEGLLDECAQLRVAVVERHRPNHDPQPAVRVAAFPHSIQN